MRIDAVDVELLMWLVRFRLRRYRHHPQFEDVLAAAYEGLWRGVTRREANPKAEGLLTEWALRGAEWQVKSWFRSAENAGRVMRRSHGRTRTSHIRSRTSTAPIPTPSPFVRRHQPADLLFFGPGADLPDPPIRLRAFVTQ